MTHAPLTTRRLHSAESGSDEARIVICICTFRNPHGLWSLLSGLDRQELATFSDSDVGIVVVDNDVDESAGTVLANYQQSGRFRLSIQNQPKRGLSHARNSALDSNLVQSSEMFAFVDDDEVPSVGWLEALASELYDQARSIVVGPVEPIFESPPPPWIISGDFFRKRCHRGDKFHTGYTSNVIIRTSIIKRLGTRFDAALSLTGGEDIIFFHKLKDCGFAVDCSPQAVVYENISAERANLSWLVRRWYRTGITSAYLRKQSIKTLNPAVANATAGLLRVIGGVIMVLAIALTRGIRDRSAIFSKFSTVCRGAGMIAAAFGQTFEEYGSSYRQK